MLTHNNVAITSPSRTRSCYFRHSGSWTRGQTSWSAKAGRGLQFLCEGSLIVNARKGKSYNHHNDKTTSSLIVAVKLISQRNEELAWNVAVAGFLCLALWPLWSARFPPMQDYPQHLLHAHVLLVHDDPAFDYNRYYECAIRPVYATFFLATASPREV